MTKVSTIPFQQTGYFSKTIGDYLEQKESITPFIGRFPSIENFKTQIEEKQQSFSQETRTVLVASLKKQYAEVKASKKTLDNIELLAAQNTFTVTTGHQLNLFTGPLYFLYKIVSAINLAEELKTTYPKNNFVPVYWMASEDHDFEEIHYFNFKGKKVAWPREASGGVGRLDNRNMEFVFEEFSKLLGNSTNAKKLKQLFKDAYLEHSNLTAATRYLANELFAEYGLVIVDGDDIDLKRQFLPFVKKDIYDNAAFKEVTKCCSKLGKHYKIQVNPREINLFYLVDGLRERMLFDGKEYRVNNSDIAFNLDELEYELKLHPERFSPNVIMRPLYQEVILPNLCYIGGGGELAYWFELKSFFEKMEVPFPILLLRNSAVLIAEKQAEKMEKLKITKEELFLKQQALVNKKITEHSEVIIDFSVQRQQIDGHFEVLEGIAEKTDKSFIGAVKAQKQKQLNGLDNLEKRLLKAERRKYKDLTLRMKQLQDEIFPKQSLQERNTNFSEHYLEYGEDLIPAIKHALKPLDLEFTIIEL
ncbi:bacillithiol biosynthesis cysteine-adding enzyme BshC [Urechidicola vernalis]|uniref:Putative cysteine ligase BshC n=1 Tax=Urechidicola vernalis TaxID=3075600 RepID=A0ABU2Y6U2_9FLAO|nr:bacillithiol biosynthesis cysteine-adding enzyme BshC [Urechidicola sp. P050]MDT0553928.1 bacillithiol biosynthesis cysteine-adding enzyme BshC [Urechidicola sp. P050]